MTATNLVQQKASTSALATELLSRWGTRKYTLTPFGSDALTCEAVTRITGLAANCIGKAMLVKVDNSLVIALIPGNARLSTQNLKVALNGSKASLVPPKNLQELTGLIVGAVTPLICLKRPDIQLVMDSSLLRETNINISSGDPAFGMTLAPSDLAEAFNPTISSLTEAVATTSAAKASSGDFA